ncbi:MAG: hypothetical protein Q4E35_05235, partial [Eubacteriales bacterium]|nr:hypothetical protein [Eubacteriales bacterium]
EVTEEEVPAEEAAEEAAPAEEKTEEATPVEEAAEDGSYTVEFHGVNGELYVMEGDTSIELAFVLERIGYGEFDLSEIAAVSSSDASLFSAEQDENGNWIVKANNSFATDQTLTITKLDGSVVEIYVTDLSIVAVYNKVKYETLQKAINEAQKYGGTITLLGNVHDHSKDGLEIKTDKHLTIDFAGHTYKLMENTIDNIAAKFSGDGSVTLKNGSLESAAKGTDVLIESEVDDLNIKDMFLAGVHGAKTILAITSGDVDIYGDTTIDAGAKGTAISATDIKGNTDVDVRTSGVINGKVTAVDTKVKNRVNVDLHSGYYTGDVNFVDLDRHDRRSGVRVDGGEYFDDVIEFVPNNVDYADIVSVYGKSHAAGGSVGWAAYRSAVNVPTFVNVRKSDGSLSLPWGVTAKNSTGHYTYINDQLIAPWETVQIPGCCWCWNCAKIVEGANSEWTKGTEDGLKFELNGNISYVTVDGVKVDAKIDGVTAEVEETVLEELTAGTHTFRFVLTNGSVAATTIKIVPDPEIEWSKGSENGLSNSFDYNVKKVLIDHVKVDAEIDGEDVTIDADTLNDLKTGKHTIDTVLENMAHIVSYITVK